MVYILNLIDLHTHTTASDGSFTPIELVRYAKEKGLAAIAVTDHDTIDGVEEAIEHGMKIGIEVIPGIEFSVTHGREIHLLGLNIDIKNLRLQECMELLKQERLKRYKLTIENLEKLGMKVKEDEVEEHSKSRSIGRVHIALALVKKGYVNDIKEAFDKYLGEGKPAYIIKDVIRPKEAVSIIKEAGGAAILAHPGLLKESPMVTEKIIVEFIEIGIDGIEAFHSDHDKDTAKFLKEIADRYNLLISGGSDFHGINKLNIDLGSGRNNLNLDYSYLEKIKKFLQDKSNSMNI